MNFHPKFPDVLIPRDNQNSKLEHLIFYLAICSFKSQNNLVILFYPGKLLQLNCREQDDTNTAASNDTKIG